MLLLGLRLEICEHPLEVGAGPEGVENPVLLKAGQFDVPPSHRGRDHDWQVPPVEQVDLQGRVQGRVDERGIGSKPGRNNLPVRDRSAIL
jgi:hypothetical protein